MVVEAGFTSMQCAMTSWAHSLQITSKKHTITKNTQLYSITENEKKKKKRAVMFCKVAPEYPNESQVI